MRLSLVVFFSISFLVIFCLGTIKGQEMSNTRSTIAPVADKIIHISKLFTLQPSELFEYFTNRSRLQSWLATVAEVEPRVGGKYELFWNPKDRENNSTIGCRITAFTSGQLLAFQWRSPKQFKSFANSADPLTHVVVTFVSESGGTRIHLLHSGWRSSTQWEAARLWQEKAWIGAFNQLEKLAKEKHRDRERR